MNFFKRKIFIRKNDKHHEKGRLAFLMIQMRRFMPLYFYNYAYFSLHERAGKYKLFLLLYIYFLIYCLS